jgi:nicotinamidase-related amidase
MSGRPPRTALLITDMISTWDFPDAEKLLPRALAIAPALARLSARFRAARRPVVYANDNLGRWRSERSHLLAAASTAGPRAARLTALLAPDECDYFVLKPKHSAFFATPLELLLADLKVQRLVIAGVASDQCVLASALDAKMRNFEVAVPHDTAASQTAARTRAAQQYFAHVLRADTRAAHLVEPA